MKFNFIVATIKNAHVKLRIHNIVYYFDVIFIYIR